MLTLVAIVVRFFNALTSEEREKVLIFHDSTHDRSRSKAVELPAWVHNHNSVCKESSWLPLPGLTGIVFCLWRLSSGHLRKGTNQKLE